MLKIKKINARNFKKFGWVIEYPQKTSQSKSKNLFCIVCSEKARLGWRIAYLVLRDKYIDKLEQHPDSLESFEPVRGSGVIYLVNRKEKGGIECFYLDKPVVLRKGVWHGVVSVSDETEIKITENYDVEVKFWPLAEPLSIIRR